VIYDLPVESSARPSDWVIKPVKELADVVGGGTPDTGVAEYWSPPQYQWVTPTDISNCDDPVLYKAERQISEAGLKGSSATLLPIGTTLLTSRATIGECKLAGIQVATNQGFASLVPKVKEEADFIFYLTQWLKPTLVRLAAGTTFIEVSRREIRRINVCVAKDNEERKRIARIISTADHGLSAAKEQLHAAVHLKTALMQQLFARGIPGWHSRFKESALGEIPECWNVVSIASVLDGPPFNGISPQSRPDPPGTPILNVECIDDGRCSLEKVSYVDVGPEDVEQYQARVGDFYVLRGNGNRDYVATGGLLTLSPKVPTIFSDKLIRLRFLSTKVTGRFVPFLWQNTSFLHRLQSKAESGSGLWMISKRDIRREIFACPCSMDEQNKIVSLLEAADASIDSARSRVVALGDLKQSLLQNLLSGRARVAA
jgi:type I restriction enzyme S subunit